MKSERGGYKCGQLSIGAHGSFMQTWIPIQTMVPLINVPKQARYHPYDTIPFVSCSLGHYGMKIIPYHLFDVFEAFEFPHLTFKRLIIFFKECKVIFML